MQIIHCKTAQQFLERAKSHLLERAAENNLILSVAEEWTTDRQKADVAVYLALVEENEKVTGAAIRQAPRPLILTRMNEEALPLIVQDILPLLADGLAVVGPRPTVDRFAGLCERLSGKSAALFMDQLIYQLTEVNDLKKSTGRFRPARIGELDLLMDWNMRFMDEVFTEDTPIIGKEVLEKKIKDRKVFVWEDGKVVSMAGASAATEVGARIGFVYTPESLRGKGYATSCVSSVCQRQLDEGVPKCFLYADSSNPTSNRLYRRIGFLPVCESAEYRL